MKIKLIIVHMDILDSLIQIRKEQKLDQKDMLKRLGVNKTTLSRYERKKRNMPFEVMKIYADLLGYEIRLLKK